MKRKALAGEISGRKRVNTKRVSSKYIGETEKNLSRVFRKTKQANPILLFDEADSLFGKRTKVKDAHDRYTNN
jgi:SpoVK/Ycf46/Vps4 family AAA+-type ATPase